jgi:hypothetical protein
MDLSRVIGAIGIQEHNNLTGSLLHTGGAGKTVPASRFVYHQCPSAFGYRDSAVCGAAVHQDDLSNHVIWHRCQDLL